MDNCDLLDLHPVWRGLDNPLDVRKAVIKALLLVQRYPLTTCKTAGIRQSATCPLCKEEPETTAHFLLYCGALQQTRNKYLSAILEGFKHNQLSIHPESIITSILDSQSLPFTDTEKQERLTRNLIFKLHHRRSVLLGGESTYKDISSNI